MARPPQIPNRQHSQLKPAPKQDQSIVSLFQQGLSFHQKGQLSQAKAAYEQVLEKQPKNFDALHLLGVIFLQSGSENFGLNLFDKAVAIEPDNAIAFYNRGIALQNLRRLEESLASYDRSLAIKPGYPGALFNRGNVLRGLNRLEESIESYEKTLQIKPDHLKALLNRGAALEDLKRLDDALASYDKAIALKPDYADAFNNRGAALEDLNRLDDALASYDKAIALKPDYADAFNNRGNTLKDIKRLDDALASYDKAIALKPDCEFLQGTKLHTQMQICDWSDLKNQLNGLEASIAKGLKVTPPLPMLGLSDRPEIQLKASRIYANGKYLEPSVQGEFKTQTASRKIRIGYYSADFHNHATSFLMAELFEAHDSQKFELYGFSFGPDKQDEMRNRVAISFNLFFDVTKKSDLEVAQMSRDLGIDIAVDLKGFTQYSRTGIFAEHCAPVQVNYLGYPGTLAAPYFDYIVADKTLIPQENQQYYSEKIIYLPHSYQVNDSKRKISERVFTRQELGLPESGFVFCCFNNNYKILPATFDVWMRLLKTVDLSVLWLFEGNPTAAKNLRKEAEIRGVDSARLVFAPRMKLEEHLARHRFADLFIDTLPCNAHTTASDALWAGLPVLTQMGQSFAARVAASLLNAMDLPELITKTQEEYEARAIELANDPLQLTEIKKKLERKRETSPLFDGQLFARHIEAAYAEIHRRHLNGEMPEHIEVWTCT